MISLNITHKHNGLAFIEENSPLLSNASLRKRLTGFSSVAEKQEQRKEKRKRPLLREGWAAAERGPLWGDKEAVSVYIG